jgi:hypothetical protein
MAELYYDIRLDFSKAEQDIRNANLKITPKWDIGDLEKQLKNLVIKPKWDISDLKQQLQGMGMGGGIGVGMGGGGNGMAGGFIAGALFSGNRSNVAYNTVVNKQRYYTTNNTSAVQPVSPISAAVEAQTARSTLDSVLVRINANQWQLSEEAKESHRIILEQGKLTLKERERKTGGGRKPLSETEKIIREKTAIANKMQKKLSEMGGIATMGGLHGVPNSGDPFGGYKFTDEEETGTTMSAAAAAKAGGLPPNMGGGYVNVGALAVGARAAKIQTQRFLHRNPGLGTAGLAAFGAAINATYNITRERYTNELINSSEQRRAQQEAEVESIGMGLPGGGLLTGVIYRNVGTRYDEANTAARIERQAGARISIRANRNEIGAQFEMGKVGIMAGRFGNNEALINAASKIREKELNDAYKTKEAEYIKLKENSGDQVAIAEAAVKLKDESRRTENLIKLNKEQTKNDIADFRAGQAAIERGTRAINVSADQINQQMQGNFITADAMGITNNVNEQIGGLRLKDFGGNQTAMNKRIEAIKKQGETSLDQLLWAPPSFATQQGKGIEFGELSTNEKDPGAIIAAAKNDINGVKPDEQVTLADWLGKIYMALTNQNN